MYCGANVIKRHAQTLIKSTDIFWLNTNFRWLSDEVLCCKKQTHTSPWCNNYNYKHLRNISMVTWRQFSWSCCCVVARSVITALYYFCSVYHIFTPSINVLCIVFLRTITSWGTWIATGLVFNEEPTTCFLLISDFSIRVSVWHLTTSPNCLDSHLQSWVADGSKGPCVNSAAEDDCVCVCVCSRDPSGLMGSCS